MTMLVRLPDDVRDEISTMYRTIHASRPTPERAATSAATRDQVDVAARSCSTGPSSLARGVAASSAPASPRAAAAPTPSRRDRTEASRTTCATTARMYGRLNRTRARRVVWTVHDAGSAPKRARYGSASDTTDRRVGASTHATPAALSPAPFQTSWSDTRSSRALTMSRT